MSKTLLIIEDEPALQGSLKQTLEEAGFVVLQGMNGVEGLEIVKKNPVDLILLDILMPRMDGTEFIAELKKYGHQNIPIIIITNLNSVASQESVRAVLIKSDTSLKEIVQRVKKELGMDVTLEQILAQTNQ